MLKHSAFNQYKLHTKSICRSLPTHSHSIIRRHLNTAMCGKKFIHKCVKKEYCMKQVQNKPKRAHTHSPLKYDLKPKTFLVYIDKINTHTQTHTLEREGSTKSPIHIPFILHLSYECVPYTQCRSTQIQSQYLHTTAVAF